MCGNVPRRAFCQTRAVQSSLENVAALFGKDDEWEDERVLVEAVNRELRADWPTLLKAASGAWEDPYLALAFTHDDGTVISVTQGDGYTAVVGGGVDYKGYLDTSSLIDVLRGALRGRTSYVRQTRFGFMAGDYFEVVGREGERLGLSSQGIAGALPFILRLIPLAPTSVRRARISFESTPAVAT